MLEAFTVTEQLHNLLCAQMTSLRSNLRVSYQMRDQSPIQVLCPVPKLNFADMLA